MTVNTAITVYTFLGKQLETIEAETPGDLCTALNQLESKALLRCTAVCAAIVLIFFPSVMLLAPYDGPMLLKTAYFFLICAIVTPLAVKVTWLADEYIAYRNEYSIAEHEWLNSKPGN